MAFGILFEVLQITLDAWFCSYLALVWEDVHEYEIIRLSDCKVCGDIFLDERLKNHPIMGFK